MYDQPFNGYPQCNNLMGYASFNEKNQEFDQELGDGDDEDISSCDSSESFNTEEVPCNYCEPEGYFHCDSNTSVSRSSGPCNCEYCTMNWSEDSVSDTNSQTCLSNNFENKELCNSVSCLQTHCSCTNPNHDVYKIVSSCSPCEYCCCHPEVRGSKKKVNVDKFQVYNHPSCCRSCCNNETIPYQLISDTNIRRVVVPNWVTDNTNEVTYEFEFEEPNKDVDHVPYQIKSNTSCSQSESSSGSEPSSISLQGSKRPSSSESPHMALAPTFMLQKCFYFTKVCNCDPESSRSSEEPFRLSSSPSSSSPREQYGSEECTCIAEQSETHSRSCIDQNHQCFCFCSSPEPSKPSTSQYPLEECYCRSQPSQRSSAPTRDLLEECSCEEDSSNSSIPLTNSRSSRATWGSGCSEDIHPSTSYGGAIDYPYVKGVKCECHETDGGGTRFDPDSYLVERDRSSQFCSCEYEPIRNNSSNQDTSEITKSESNLSKSPKLSTSSQTSVRQSTKPDKKIHGINMNVSKFPKGISGCNALLNSLMKSCQYNRSSPKQLDDPTRIKYDDCSSSSLIAHPTITATHTINTNARKKFTKNKLADVTSTYLGERASSTRRRSRSSTKSKSCSCRRSPMVPGICWESPTMEERKSKSDTEESTQTIEEKKSISETGSNEGSITSKKSRKPTKKSSRACGGASGTGDQVLICPQASTKSTKCSMTSTLPTIAEEDCVCMKSPSSIALPEILITVGRDSGNGEENYQRSERPQEYSLPMSLLALGDTKSVSTKTCTKSENYPLKASRKGIKGGFGTKKRPGREIGTKVCPKVSGLCFKSCKSQCSRNSASLESVSSDLRVCGGCNHFLPICWVRNCINADSRVVCCLRLCGRPEISFLLTLMIFYCIFQSF